MKKVLLLTCLSISAGAVLAYPGPDVTNGGSPFLLLQQQNFQKMEYADYKRFKDAEEKPAADRIDSPKTMQTEFELKNLKRDPKIELGKSKTETSTMELKLDNGKVKIESED